MIDKIIDIAKQELDEYGAELVSLLVLEKQAGNSCSKWELMTTSKRLKRLAKAIDELVEQED